MKKSLKDFKKSLRAVIDPETYPLVSVIIPAHNEASAITGMLGCMKNQTYPKIEVIVVDDGSTDDTFETVSGFRAGHKKIKAVKQKKSGVSAARNLGLSMAKGKYICFFDADDYVPEYVVEKMVRCAESRSADLVIGQMRVIATGANEVSKFTSKLSKRKDIDKLDRNLIFSTSLANKMFRADVIKNNSMSFKPIDHYEDGCFLFEYISLCGKITGCNHETYHYIKKPFWEGRSLSQTYTLKSIQDSEIAYDSMLRSAERIVENDRRTYDEVPPEEASEERDEVYARFLSVMNRRAVKACMKAPYRHIWVTDDDAVEAMKAYYNKYFDGMLPVDVEIHYRQDADLGIERGIRDKADFSSEPLISIVMSRFGDYSGSARLTQLVAEGYYRQDFPAFELIIDEQTATDLTDEQRSRRNLKVSGKLTDASTFEEMTAAAADECRSGYAVITKEVFIPGSRTLKDMYNEIGDDDCISAPLLVQRGRSYEAEEIKSDKALTGNKLIKVSSLKRILSDRDSISGRSVESTFIHLTGE